MHPEATFPSPWQQEPEADSEAAVHLWTARGTRGAVSPGLAQPEGTEGLDLIPGGTPRGAIALSYGNSIL